MKFGLFYKNQGIIYSAESAIILINIPTAQIYQFAGIQYRNDIPIDYKDYTKNTWSGIGKRRKNSHKSFWCLVGYRTS